MKIDIRQKQAGWFPPSCRTTATGDVLMLGFMNEEALAETQRSGEVGLLQPLAQ